MWHAETNYGHPHAFAICNTWWVINAQRQIMVILRPLSFRSSKSSDKHAETNYGHFAPFVIQGQWVKRWAETNYAHSPHLFAIQRRSCPVARRDKLLSFCALSPRLDRARGHAETNYGHFASCANQKERTRQYQDDVGHSVLIIFKIFAGSAGGEIHRPNGVSLEWN